MIEAIMKIAVQEVCFTTVTCRSDRSIVIPESWDCGILFVKYLDSPPKFLVGRELQIMTVLFLFQRRSDTTLFLTVLYLLQRSLSIVLLAAR